jgi:tellurite resistance protein TerC
VGAWLIAQFHWILYLYGAFLLFTGIKMWWAAGQEPDLDNNPALKWMRSRLKISPDYDGERFLTVVGGVKMATPLLVVMLLIGIVDVVFAVDSIPAIFAITTDPFIVLTSNVFAILGLRAMYFLLANMHERFHLLSYGLAIVLVFIGAKMLLIDVYNQGGTGADASTTRVIFENVGVTDIATPALDPRSRTQLVVAIPDACFDANNECRFALGVDAMNAVAESSETNNDVAGACGPQFQ